MVLIMPGCKNNTVGDVGQLSEEERKIVFPKLVRYIAKPPKLVKGQQRFESRFDNYYNNAEKDFKWDLFYSNSETNVHYFLVTKEASSLYQKRIAIAGSYKLNHDTMSDYKEIFWTFKLKEQELKDKSVHLFDLMIKGEDLTKYYPQNSKDNEEWIEFPDATTYFNSDSLVWMKIK